MGIQGLLQSLKPIHVKKHLQEYSGKTIAVDAYGWLHKGLYSCATELATGKKTHRYVDYAMHRVRLLRHFNIQPYIVFDGGPLPAKKGTEKEREQKRKEYLSKGNGLAAQGKHSQARECYVKCVDVTPQMAFQFIKALRAENVSYVVAPYEADAQLAYLEKIGLVDAILTEDSDLLVFGCRNVLYKLDVVDNTVTSICRDQFGSLTTSSSDPNAISLYGWSDAQFRAMAILSGCDYLPSIPGVGLKTANSLLRKWKTAEQVIRAITMEGKKSVPTNYWNEFQLAELCFLHQRVFCPLSKKLVHLNDPGASLNEDVDTYVGSDLGPGVAEGIASGDVCPNSRLPMVDINASFVPHASKKPLPGISMSTNRSRVAKGKMSESLPASILDFFGPHPVIPRSKPCKPISTAKPTLTGKASGKRTLADIMDNDLETKKRLRESPTPLKTAPRESRFFASSESRTSRIRRRHSEGELPLSGPPHRQGKDNKENDYIMVVDDDYEVDEACSDLEGSDLSIKTQVDASDVLLNMQLDAADFLETVEQEDGYISPPDYSKDAQDLSSPILPRNRRKTTISLKRSPSVHHFSEEEDADFVAQVLSSPISAKRPKHNTQQLEDYKTPTQTKHQELEDVPSPTGPDLRSLLGVDCDSELDVSCKTRSPSPSPDTPKEGRQGASQVIHIDGFQLDLEVEEEERLCEQSASRNKAVMDGWRRKWALPSLQAEKTSANNPKVFALGSGAIGGANLRRSETTVIMPGPHSISGLYKPPKSAPSKISVPTAPRMGKLVFESKNVSSTTPKASKTVENVISCLEDTKTRTLVQ